MIIVQLQAIKFRDRPDVQTVTYAKRVPEWMAQWTVAANYAPALSTDKDVSLVEAAYAEAFWRDMNSAVPELVKRDKLDILDDFEFRFSMHEAGPGQLSRYCGCGSFIGGDAIRSVAPINAGMRNQVVQSTRDGILSLVRKHFPDGNLYEQFRHHKYSLKALCDEQGMEDVTNLLSDFAAVFEVGGSEVLDMDLDQMVDYIINL